LARRVLPRSMFPSAPNFTACIIFDPPLVRSLFAFAFVSTASGICGALRPRLLVTVQRALKPRISRDTSCRRGACYACSAQHPRSPVLATIACRLRHTRAHTHTAWLLCLLLGRSLSSSFLVSTFQADAPEAAHRSSTMPLESNRALMRRPTPSRALSSHDSLLSRLRQLLSSAPFDCACCEGAKWPIAAFSSLTRAPLPLAIACRLRSMRNF
jgi:hypothetical protein